MELECGAGECFSTNYIDRKNMMGGNFGFDGNGTTQIERSTKKFSGYEPLGTVRRTQIQSEKWNKKKDEMEGNIVDEEHGYWGFT